MSVNARIQDAVNAAKAQGNPDLARRIAQLHNVVCRACVQQDRYLLAVAYHCIRRDLSRDLWPDMRYAASWVGYPSKGAAS